MIDPKEKPISGRPRPTQKKWFLFFGLLVLGGVVSFLVGVSGPQPGRVWQAYLVNFVFWTGLAAGSILFVAILNMTNARWARSLKRIAEAPALFLPFSLALLLILYLGREEIFPWIREPAHGKEAWLSADFLFIRNGISLFLLTLVAMGLLYYSLRGDRPASMASAAGSGGPTPEDGKAWRVQVVLSPILGILYALVLSLLAFDLIMSLDPHWVSTLFGAYYFIGSLYTALAALVLMAGVMGKTLGLSEFIQPRHFHELGKLLLAFCLITGDFFYSQFLVIWYGNMPEETRYVILRVREEPWHRLAWTVLIVSFAVPFLVLLSRRIKLKPRLMIILSIVILVGMWLERFLLVAPSIWKEPGLPLGVMEVMISAGFLGAMGIMVLAFFRYVPSLPHSDPLWQEEVEKGIHESA